MTVQAHILASYLNQEVARHSRSLFSAADVLGDDAKRAGISSEALAHSSVAAWMEDRQIEFAEMHREHRYMELADTAAGLLNKAGVPVVPNSPEFRQFCRELCETTAEAYGQGMEIAEGSRSVGASPKEAIASPIMTGTTAPVGVTASITLPAKSTAAAIREFLIEWERTERPNKKHFKKVSRALRLLEWFVGESKPVSSIHKRNIKELVAAMAQLPTNYEKLAGEKSLSQVIEFGRLNGIKPLASNTAAGAMSAIRKFFGWCEDKDLIAADPSLSIKMPVRKASSHVPHEREQLKAFFNYPLFTGCKSKGQIHKPGTFEVRNWLYWVPLIAYFTGARLGEVCQLDVADIQEIDGVKFIHVREGADKRVKTKAGIRRVPIHNGLVALGFWSFCQHQKKLGHRRLFPDRPAAVNGYVSHTPSRRYSVINKKLFGPQEAKSKRCVFHSFRHTMKDAMRESDVPYELQLQLLGHDGSGAAAKYGRGYSLNKLNEAMQGIRMPYSLSHLKPWRET